MVSSHYRPPDWASSLQTPPPQRLSLGDFPTQLSPWPLLAFPEMDLWIKRDDRSGVALSGNKIRKLEFLLADAKAQQCDVVVTCGGIQSNHCRATAVAARTMGLDSVLLLRTSTPHEDPGLVGNLLLDRMVGAEIKLITHAQYRERNKYLVYVAAQLREKGRRPYIIPEGGSNAMGTWGYVEAVREWLQQSDTLGVHFDDVVFACGSGGTAAGIALGVALSGVQTRVHAINVCDDAAYFYGIVDRLFQELGTTLQARDVLRIIDGYKGLGYAVSREEELALLQDIARESAIFLDPVYTGKAIYGLQQEWMQRREQFAGKRILFIHTGGLFGLYNKQDQLMPLLQDPAPQPLPELP